MKITLTTNMGMPTLKVNTIYDATETANYYLVHDDNNSDYPPRYVDKWKAKVVIEEGQTNEDVDIMKYVKQKENVITEYLNHNDVYTVNNICIKDGKEISYILNGFSFYMDADDFYEVDEHGNTIETNIDTSDAIDDADDVKKNVYVKVISFPTPNRFLKDKIYKVERIVADGNYHIIDEAGFVTYVESSECAIIDSSTPGVMENNEDDEWNTQKQIYVKITNPAYQGHLKFGKIYKVKSEYDGSYTIVDGSTTIFINKANLEVVDEKEYNESLKSENDDWNTSTLPENKVEEKKVKNKYIKLKSGLEHTFTQINPTAIYLVLEEICNGYTIKIESGRKITFSKTIFDVCDNKGILLNIRLKNSARFKGLHYTDNYVVDDSDTDMYKIYIDNEIIEAPKNYFDITYIYYDKSENKNLTNTEKNGKNDKKIKKGKKMKVRLKNKMAFHFKGYHNLTGEYDVFNENADMYFIRGPKGRFMKVEKDYFVPVGEKNMVKNTNTNCCNDFDNSTDVWETKIDIVKDCSKAPKEMKVFINLLANVKIKELMSIFPSTEWLAYLIGERGEGFFIVKDLLIPKQSVTSASVTDVDSTVPEGVTVIGVIHSHHHMGIGFSETDEEWINQNHNLSILVSHTKMCANVRFKTPCGGYHILEGKIITNYNIEWNKEAFKKEIKENISEPSSRFTSNYGYGFHGNGFNFNNLPLQLRGQNDTGKTGSLLDEIDESTNIADNSSYNV